jgi:hypothetical protein
MSRVINSCAALKARSSKPGHVFMKVLFTISEFANFAKSGGLRDVSAGLPQALQRRDIDVRVLLPAYAEVIAKASDINVVAHLYGLAGIRRSWSVGAGNCGVDQQAVSLEAVARSIRNIGRCRCRSPTLHRSRL